MHNKKQFSLHDLLDFVLLHRGDEVFRNYDAETISNNLAYHMVINNDKGLYYANPETGALEGLITFEPLQRTRVLVVYDLLTISKEALLAFIDIFHRRYRYMQLATYRDDKMILYQDTNHFMSLLKAL